MFICDSCKNVSKPNEPQTRRILDTRPKKYYNEKNQLIGEGFEIVKEIKLCEKCSSLE